VHRAVIAPAPQQHTIQSNNIEKSIPHAMSSQSLLRGTGVKKQNCTRSQGCRSWGARAPQYFAKGAMHQSGPSNN